MTIIAKTKYLNFKSTKSPSGKDWFYVVRNNDTNKHDSACVITTVVKVNGEYNFLLMKTNRPPISNELKAKYCLESPAGLIGDVDINESTIECAKKELLEETGLVSDKMFLELFNCSTSAGLSSETLSYLTAIVEDDNIIQKPVSDGGIIQERFYVPVNEIESYLNNIDNKIISVAAATVCGIYFALSRINKLNKENNEK